MTVATVGARYQVVIPGRERAKVGLKPHSRVMVEAREDYIVVQPLDGRSARGIGRELRDGTDAADYVRRLRSEWERRA